MMKAVQFKFGGDHSVVDIPKPQTLGSDEVLVKVKYSALDPTHEAILQKTMTGFFVHSRKEPLYLGYHFSGTVEQVGSNVTTNTDKKEGSTVFGFLQYDPSQAQGAFSEYIVVKADECALQPSKLPDPVAAASATEAITALQAIRDLGGLTSDKTILINGAAGGVGSAAVQIAKALGAAHVTAICSTKDVARVEKWGANVVVDRTKTANPVANMLDQGATFDVILDAPNMLPSVATNLLIPNGTLVHTIPTMTFIWNKVKTLFSSKQVTFVECHSKESDLELIGKWITEGKLEIPIDSTFKICEMKSAMAKHTGQKQGRVIIQVEGGWN